MKITTQMIDRAAKAIYRFAGWDRAWREIDPSGRRRFRFAAKAALNAAHKIKHKPR